MATQMFQTTVLLSPNYHSNDLVKQGQEARERADAIERRQGKFWDVVCERLEERLISPV